MYKDIKYFPMTYYDCRLRGIRTDRAAETVIIMTNWLQYFDNGTGKDIPLNGDRFRKFLEICWPSVDEVTFSSGIDRILSPRFPRAWERRGELEELKVALRPWLVGRTVSDWWFGYGRRSTKMNRYRYRADEGLKETIYSLYRDVFLREPLGQPSEEVIPWFEDLCLFSRGKLFFGSISHEGEAYLYPLNDEMSRAVSTLGGWETCHWRDERSRTDIRAFIWKESN